MEKKKLGRTVRVMGGRQFKLGCQVKGIELSRNWIEVSHVNIGAFQAEARANAKTLRQNHA